MEVRLNYLFTLLLNYPSVALIGGFLGFYAFYKKSSQRLVFIFFMGGFLAQAIWSSNYMIWDMFAFGLPVWVMFGLMIILGFDYLLCISRPVKIVTLCLLPTLLIGPLLYVNIPDWEKQNGFWKEYFTKFKQVRNIWDPSLFFANPIKTSYREAELVATKLFTTLPYGAHLFDSDSKTQYLADLYYQDVMKKRTDINFHVLLGEYYDHIKAAKTAREIIDLIDKGQDVFITSPYFPERLALLQLYWMLSPIPKPAWERIESLALEEFERTFPVYILQRIPLIENKPYFIYKIQRRQK